MILKVIRQRTMNEKDFRKKVQRFYNWIRKYDIILLKFEHHEHQDTRFPKNSQHSREMYKQRATSVHCSHLESMKRLTVILHTGTVETVYIFPSGFQHAVNSNFHITGISPSERTSDQHTRESCCLVSTDPWVGFNECCLNWLCLF